jgi:hypothetical protein
MGKKRIIVEERIFECDIEDDEWECYEHKDGEIKKLDKDEVEKLKIKSEEMIEDGEDNRHEHMD